MYLRFFIKRYLYFNCRTSRNNEVTQSVNTIARIIGTCTASVSVPSYYLKEILYKIYETALPGNKVE